MKFYYETIHSYQIIMFTCDEKMFVLLGIFQPHIQYLLCLATPVDIVLLGVSFSRPYDGMIPFFFLFLYKKKYKKK